MQASMEMALKVYTAVANPITLDGRIKICRGALRNTDYREAIKTLTLPVVVVQGTDNMLVSAANADVLLEGRSARHVWSHEHEVADAAGSGGGPAAGEEGAGDAGASGGVGSSSEDAVLHNVLLQPRAIAHVLVRAVPCDAWLRYGAEVLSGCYLLVLGGWGGGQ